MSKKILAMLLVIVMVSSMVPMVASAAEGCNHDTGEVKYTDNKNGTHQVTCKCGKVIAEAAECEFVGGRCVCGARKAGCKHDGYDYVPRTDSAFVEWLYALIFG